MMEVHIDFKELKTSWTKYDIVQVLDVIYSVETIQKYKNREALINEPILRSFLGIQSLNDPIPDYWIEIQKYPNEKKIFALLALIFTHGGVVEDFAIKYSKDNLKGILIVDSADKQLTNLRSALVVSGATDPANRRKQDVPYDFSIVFYNPEVGKLFKKVLIERFSRFIKDPLSDEDFYRISFENKFEKALGVTQEQYKNWLEGKTFDGHYIKKICIENFFCITEPVKLDFNESKEIYFLGENGDGKSLLLMALYLAFNGNHIENKTDKDQTGRAIDILDKYPDALSGSDEFEHEYNLQHAIYLENFYAYGTHRGRESADTWEKYGFMSLFNNDLTMKSPVQWIKDLKLNEERQPDKMVIATRKLSEILYTILEKKVKTIIEGSEVYFEEKGYRLTIDQLSEGYRSVIIFVCDLLYRLVSKQDGKGNVFETKGVVLIDEIDQHLHPKWQRVIVQRLRKLFPNIQFFFTTHSPTIIQGASEDALIYRVYREDGVTKVSEPYFRKDLDHMMMNTLMTSSLFGLLDSRLDSDNNEADTDDTYLLYRINKKLEQKLSEQKAEGKNFITDQEIDNLIDNILTDELNHDKN